MDRRVLQLLHRAMLENAAYQRWRDIYPYMLSLVEAGLTRPMWRAPGV